MTSCQNLSPIAILVTFKQYGCLALNENAKRFLTNQLVWIGIYFGIALTVTLLLDFPLSLLVVLAIILPLSLYRRRRYFKSGRRRRLVLQSRRHVWTKGD